MPPFFVNVVSAYDLWSYMSSRGGLVAGRVSADESLFPYETVDRIHDAHHHTGPTTMMWIDGVSNASEYWQPFVAKRPGGPPIQRNMYKHVVGNQVTMEEIHEPSGLVYRSRWAASDALGWVRTVTVTNDGNESIRLSFLDGFRNVLPWGVTQFLTQNYSCLADAYKRSKRDAKTGMATFSATAAISDGTSPSEVLRANTVWASSAMRLKYSLDESVIEQFQNREPLTSTNLLLGKRGNYFVSSEAQTVEPGESLRWDLIADVGLDHSEVEQLRIRLDSDPPDAEQIDGELAKATESLMQNVASADGLQECGDTMNNVHHFSNVLFNNMRGGVFDKNYEIPTEDFRRGIELRSKKIASAFGDLLSNLPQHISLSKLHESIKSTGSADLVRLAHEYLPIRFSRRHGDPSRPWNHFSIRLKDRDGNPLLKYQGNWRDIFQNWEGLTVSYPGFLPSIISKFVNGSTVDGHNPYRVTDQGLDWEVPEPNDPWSNYGYWGDHQIIYLLKLLEALRDRQPDQLDAMLTEKTFGYLNVPYRLKSYSAIVEQSRDTVDFDFELNRQITDKVGELGEDAKLWRDGDQVIHVNLLEKLLVSMLAKMSNLVVGAGIWMNTQRPEWNDANNALVGHGVSMVTLCYLRRYMKFIGKLVEEAKDMEEVELSAAVSDWLTEIAGVLGRYQPLLQEQDVTDRQRRELLDELGLAFCRYRSRVYGEGPVGQSKIDKSMLCDFLKTAVKYADHSIRLNHRDDALYHAYNLCEFSGDELRVHRLYEMLEGQVAVLSSGCLSPTEAGDLLDAMFLGRMYRPDQNTFMLYPERELADFADKNVVPESGVAAIPLLSESLAKGNDRLILADPNGIYRFNADLHERTELEACLKEMSADEEWRSLVESSEDQVIQLYERVFEHHSYTGRSGTMYGYEGLGCIYWHMVSKLLLAVQENYQAAADSGSWESAERLKQLYYQVRGGLGPAKTPEEFGAFPMDAYSHTSSHSGARQPGMTGQVKEEVLTRFGELGVRVRNGVLSFQPTLLHATEFVTQSRSFSYFDVEMQPQEIAVPTNGLAFTYCQVPIIYRAAGDDSAEVVVSLKDGGVVHCQSMQLNETLSSLVLGRTGQVESIEVRLDNV